MTESIVDARVEVKKKIIWDAAEGHGGGAERQRYWRWRNTTSESASWKQVRSPPCNLVSV